MPDKPLTIAVSGAAGRMGSTYAQELIKQGHHIKVYDPQRLRVEQLYDGKAEICTSNTALVRGADFVLLFVPVEATGDVLKEISPIRPPRSYRKEGGRFVLEKDGKAIGYLRPNVIIGSAASAKMDVAKLEEQYVSRQAYPQSRIVDFHPMHGEGVEVKGQNLLTVPVRDFDDGSGTAEALMQELFRPMGVKIKHVDSPSVHDEMLSDPQGGNHCIAFSRDTAWYMNRTDPDGNATYTDPLGDAKSVHARRPLGLNLDVYVVTMLFNRFVPPYFQKYEDILAEVYKKVVENRREELCSMFEETREHLGRDAIRDARERLSAAYGPNLDATPNSHLSDLAWGELYKRRNKKPTDFLECESFHYALGRMILSGVFGGDVRKFVDNAIDNPQTRWQDINYLRAVAVVNQIVQSGDGAALLRHFEKLKKYFNGREGVKMQRDLAQVGRHSIVLSRSLKDRTDEYAKARNEWIENAKQN